MIINTGCRTDIPAFYSDWFYKRIKEGFVYVRNPYYKEQVTKYKLNTDVVDCLAFCTKNPGPMLKRIHEIDKFNQFWFVTITPYEKDIECNVPDKGIIIENFKKLSDIVGVNSIVWRYDPIFINEKYTLKKHLESFEKMAASLCGYTHECVISFIDLYEKTKRNFSDARTVRSDERYEIAEEFVRIGKKYDISIKSCAEGQELTRCGVDCSGCMTKEVIEKAIGTKLKLHKKQPVREGCGCLLGSDIGAYNTCGHGCVYCYANYDQVTVKVNMKQHDPKSPFLVGGSFDGDIIREAKQESNIDNQISFF